LVVPGTEGALGSRRHTWDCYAGQKARDEVRAGEVVKSAVEGCLPGASVVVDEERVQIDPATTRGGQLDAVGPPVGLDRVAQSSQHREGGLLAFASKSPVPGQVGDEEQR
jgi:hypothetical protein